MSLDDGVEITIYYFTTKSKMRKKIRKINKKNVKTANRTK